MKMRALILTLAISALAIDSTAGDPITGVNTVGYINFSIGPGLSLICNPLRPENARISALFQQKTLFPNGTAIHVFRDSQLVTATFNAAVQAWQPEEAARLELLPGEGFFFENPGKAALTVTFVGEIRQGVLTNRIPQGFSLRASIVPQEGSLDLLGFPAEPGDEVFLFDSRTQRYVSYFFDDFDRRWQPALPSVKVCEAFFVYKQHATDWIRTFSP